MGMFDEVGGICEECGTWVYTQTKAGDCTLSQMHVDRAPLRLVSQVNGEILTCEECGKQYMITVFFKASMEPI